MQIWNLDDKGTDATVNRFLTKNGFDKGTHERFKIGQTIEFWTGYNGDIRAKATIKGLNGGDIYVYTDCYWFPIQDDAARKIKVLS